MDIRGYKRLVRDINENLVFTVIQRFGPISRSDIARLTGLSLPTISAIIGELLKTGFIEVVGTGESRGGRKPQLLAINPRAGFVAGVKLMETSLEATIVDLEASILVHRSFPLPRANSPEPVLLAIEEAVTELARGLKLEVEQLLGLGIGMAGVIDSDRGICRYSPFFGWTDVRVTDFLQAHLSIPVYVDNDVNTLTIAEQWFGKGKGRRNFVVVTVGRGVGAGMVINGAFYRGSFGGVGELGHITVAEDGPPCHCGKRGCLGTLASDPAVEREVAILKGERIPFDHIVSLADSGDRLAQKALADSGKYLGIGIAIVVNLLAPELVILSGEGLRAGDWRLGPMWEALRAHVFDGLLEHVEIAVEPIGDEFWARGAAALVLEKLFRPPVYKTAEYMPLHHWTGKGGDIGGRDIDISAPPTKKGG